jgi:hypothetical protein
MINAIRKIDLNEWGKSYVFLVIVTLFQTFLLLGSIHSVDTVPMLYFVVIVSPIAILLHLSTMIRFVYLDFKNRNTKRLKFEFLIALKILYSP